MSYPHPDDALLLFNDPRYHGLNLERGHTLFRYDHEEGGRQFGSLIGVMVDDTIDCGYRAPYGGPDVSREGESTAAIMRFLRDAVDAARRAGAATLRIRARPSYQSSNDASVLFALLNLDFRVESCEFSQGIDVTRYADFEDYIAKLKASQRNQIRRGLRLGSFEELRADACWSEGYDLLSLNRSFRGAALRFSLDYLLRLRAIFPRRIRMTMLRADGRAIAAALVYRVKPRVDHIVAWGDDKTRREIAPVGTMAVHLLQGALRDDVDVLDIGVSSIDGAPDEGLIAFKRHTLAEPALRLNLVRSL